MGRRSPACCLLAVLVVHAAGRRCAWPGWSTGTAARSATGRRGAGGASGSLCAVLGVQVVPDAPVASTSAAALAYDQVRQVRTAAGATSSAFATAAAADPFRDTPGRQLLTGLRGKDVDRRLRRELRPGRGPGLGVLARGRRRARRRDQPAAAAGFSVAQRLPHLADIRRHQLAGPLDPAVRAVDRQPAALRPAGRQRPLHPQRRVQAGRLAHRRRRAVERAGLAGGHVVLPLRHRSTTRGNVGYAGPEVQLRHHARPVHPVGLPAARARHAAPRAGDGRDRPGVQPHPVGAAAAAGRLERGRRRLGLRRDAGAGAVAADVVWRDPDQVRAAYGQSDRVLAAAP